MAKVTMLESGIKGFTNAVKRVAVKDKKFAEELVYMHGIRGEIKPGAVKQLTKDMFDASGKMTKKGVNEAKRLIRELNLPANATWDDALEAIGKFKDSLPKIQMLELKKLELPEIDFSKYRKIN